MPAPKHPTPLPIDPTNEMSHHIADGGSWPNYIPYTALKDIPEETIHWAPPTTHYPCRVCGAPIRRSTPTPHISITGEIGHGKTAASLRLHAERNDRILKLLTAQINQRMSATRR